MPEQSRTILGVLVIALVSMAGALTWLFDRPTAAGISLRSAILLGALWLAWPELTRRSFRRTAVIGLGAAIVLFRPRAAWVVIPVLAVWLATGRR